MEGRGRRSVDLLEGKTRGMPSSLSVSTRLQRIAELARTAADMAFTSLAHHVDVEFLRQAFDRTRQDGAVGIDEQTAAEYAANLADNLQSLLHRFKSGSYQAPPVKRVYIPKADGRALRPLGIPTFEDKVLQRAVTMLLEAVYEQDFKSCSFGFRRGRSAHDALNTLWQGLMAHHGGWVLDADIQGFFENLDHGHLRRILDRRVRDGVVRRTIDKWLRAGVWENGALWHPSSGTPQGGVISPMLSNIYLHEVLDSWFEATVRPGLKGRALLVRYADDFVIGFNREDDARQVQEMLSVRLAAFGLALHPTKTRLIRFAPPSPPSGGGPRGDRRRETFDFLGFTHYWGKSRKGRWTIQRHTATSRFTRALWKVSAWCRRHRHLGVHDQHAGLCRMLLGHYQYFGITFNFAWIARFKCSVERVWHHWLCRRSQRASIPWTVMHARLSTVWALPRPRIVHRLFAT